MSKAGLFVLEMTRIVIVLGIMYCLIGWLVFQPFYESSENDAVLFLHIGITMMITFLWYRVRGKSNRWFP